MSKMTRNFLTAFGIMMLASIIAPAAAKAEDCLKYNLYLDDSGHAVCMNKGLDCTVCAS